MFFRILILKYYKLPFNKPTYSYILSALSSLNSVLYDIIQIKSNQIIYLATSLKHSY